MAFEFNSEKSEKIKEALKKEESKTVSANNESKSANKDEQQKSKTPPPVKPNSDEAAKAIRKIGAKSKLNKMAARPVTEMRGRYNFTLEPSMKEKADKLAKENNFPSTSSFLNEMIKNL